jgi:hypothetical protein
VSWQANGGERMVNGIFPAGLAPFFFFRNRDKAGLQHLFTSSNKQSGEPHFAVIGTRKLPILRKESVPSPERNLHDHTFFCCLSACMFFSIVHLR